RVGKRRAQVLREDPPPRGSEPRVDAQDRAAEAGGGAPGEQRERSGDAAEDRELERVASARAGARRGRFRRWRAQGPGRGSREARRRKKPGSSTSTESRTATTGSGISPASFTASFSVVTTRLDPVRAAASRMRASSRGP